MNLRVVHERAIDSVAEPRRADRDQDLLQALRRRDPMAAERLVTRYGGRAYRLASRITGNGSDAEEVVQDALWRVVRRIDTFRGASAFGSWLYRIVANAAYEKLRGRPLGRRELSLDEVLPIFDESGRHAALAADWSPRVEDPGLQVELRTALGAAIEELPAAYRAVLVLRDVEGRSNREIADLLALNTTVVKMRVHRARLFLRKRLGEFMTTVEADAVAACASSGARCRPRSSAGSRLRRAGSGRDGALRHLDQRRDRPTLTARTTSRAFEINGYQRAAALR